MTSFLVTIHGQPFIVGETHLQRFRADVVDAVRAGGDFVDFPHEDGEAGVLVSSTTQLVIRRIPEAGSGHGLIEETSADGGTRSVVALRRVP